MGNSASVTAWKLVDKGDAPALQKLKKLIASGVVNANTLVQTQAKASTLLHCVVSRRRHEFLQLLLESGAQADLLDGEGKPPLHFAIQANDARAVSLLLSHGADANRVGTLGAPLSHAKSANVAGLLIEQGGANIHYKERRGDTVIVHFIRRFAKTGATSDWEVVEALLLHGANINRVDEDGNNALHVLASRNLHDELVERLTAIGVELNGRNAEGATPLHVASTLICGLWEKGERSHSIIECLLKAGSNIDAKDKEGYRAIHCALTGIYSSRRGVVPGCALDDLQLLVFHGAKWDQLCEDIVNAVANPTTAMVEAGPRRFVSIDVARAVRLCVQRWMTEYTMRLPPTSIPEEAVNGGLKATRTYVDKLAESKEVILRRKICVVGPSNWGKTSLVKSLVSDQPSLVHPDDRTIGIDKFKLSFDQNVPTGDAVVHHEVTFWDFAGQDEYQVAHSLFFSRRTLYVVCINLQAYAITFMQALLMTDDTSALDLRMNWYVEVRILRWIRLIVARQPDAEFRFVGTKNDLVSPTDDDALEDLQTRLSNVLVIVSEMKRAQPYTEQSDKELEDVVAITSLGDERLASWQSKPKVDLMVSSCSKADSVAVLKKWIINLISSSRRSYRMPDSYSNVLRIIKKMRFAATTLESSRRIQACFVNADKLIGELTKEVEGVSADECRIILQALRDLGDVLWYDDFDDAMLRETVILDPLLLIDFIRQIFNHNEKSEVMRHAKLKELLLWKNLDGVQMLAMKLVLQHFHLAFPTEKEMQVDSDLLMPAFWRSKKSAQWLFLGQPLKHPTTAKPRDWLVTVHWEIHVDYGFEDVLFDRLVVASYNSSYLRIVGPDYLLYGDIDGVKVPYACRLIADWHRTTHKRVLHLEAVLDAEAKAAAALWARFECVCSGLAAVFKTFPGLRVSICARQPSEEEGDGYDRPLVRTCTTPDPSWLPPEPTLTNCRELLTNY